MKQLLFCSLLLIAACGNNKTATPPEGPTNSTTQKKAEPSAGTSTQSDEIVGEWELVGFVGDTNDNLQIDESERGNLKPAGFKDYMKLASDGSGLFTVAKMEGKYEVTDSDGKEFLTWYDTGNGRHRVGTIIAVSKEELHIKESGGNGLFIWKRL